MRDSIPGIARTQDDPTTTGDYEATFTIRRFQEPEKELLAAILRDGIATIQKGPRGSHKTRYEYQEAVSWAKSDDQDWIGKFRPVCEALGLHDVDGIRRQIFRDKENHNG